MCIRDRSKAEYGVGGGIVWDSTSADEYSEALLKARVLTERANEFSLLETILWTPQNGYFLLEKHIERMRDSAEYFGFSFSREKIKQHLEKLSADFPFPQRIRILVNRIGEINTETKEFQTQENPFKVSLSDQHINSNEIFLYHKTTSRNIYPSLSVSYTHLTLPTSDLV